MIKHALPDFWCIVGNEGVVSLLLVSFDCPESILVIMRGPAIKRLRTNCLDLLTLIWVLVHEKKKRILYSTDSDDDSLRISAYGYDRLSMLYTSEIEF